MIEFKLETAAAGPDGAPAVSIIGIGGAGANVLDHIALEGMDGVELISMNCDARSLASSMAQRKVQLGKSLTQGLGCGGDPELGNEAAVSSTEDIREALSGSRMIFVCVGLGGGTGSGAAPIVARLARETGAFVIVFATMPFVFEGKRRMQQAESALEQIRQHANALVCFENDKMGELVLPKKGVTEAFEVADRIICQSVRAVTTVATQPGLIRIGMDDLVTALRNADSRCLFGFGQAKGEARAAEALQAALKSPLLDRGQLLEKARNVLVHICGGTNLTLFEIESLMRELTKHVSDDAQILFGAATDSRLADSLSLTIISSLGKAKGTQSAAVAQSSVGQPKTAPPAVPAVSVHTQTIPILSVQPRQVPQPPPSNVIAPPASTTTIATASVPVLRMTAQLEPLKPVNPVRPAPLTPLAPAEPDLFAAPEAEMPGGALVPEAIAEETAGIENEEERAIEATVEAEVEAKVVIENEGAGDDRFDAVVLVTETMEDSEGNETEEVTLNEEDEIPATPQSLEAEQKIAVEETFEEETVEEPIAAEEVLEEEVAAETEPQDEPVLEEVASVAADEMVCEDEEEPEAQHPAFASDRERVSSAPMRPIAVPEPTAKPPAPARKFDLREILQRQRQTRLGHLRVGYSDSAGGKPSPTPVQPLSAGRPAGPSRSTPAVDRTPDPSRVTPIRPIPAVQTGMRNTSPLIPTKTPVAPLSAAMGRAETRQATFDDRLSPATATRGGRFEKAEPTVEEGEDLDIPTFLRKKK